MTTALGVEPLTAEEKAHIQHTGHFLIEYIKDMFHLIAIGGAASGKHIREFYTHTQADAFCKSENILYHHREDCA